MKKLNKAKFIEEIGQKWIHLTVEKAVEACSYMLHACKTNSTKDESEGTNNV